MKTLILIMCGALLVTQAFATDVEKTTGEGAEFSSVSAFEGVALDELKKRACNFDAQAAYEVARRCYEAEVQPFQPEDTFNYAKLAADLGSDEGTLLLGRLYLSGLPRVCDYDVDKAEEILRPLYEKGYLPAFGHYARALMLRSGENKIIRIGEDLKASASTNDGEKAVSILDAGVEKGDPYAMRCRAMLYIAQEKDCGKFLQLITRSVETGCIQAKCDLATYYIMGTSNKSFFSPRARARAKRLASRLLFV